MGGKLQLGEAFTRAWNCLSRGEREEVRERCHDLGIHLDWLGVPRTILDQVVRDLDKTCQKAIKDREERKKARSEGKPGKRRLAGFPVFRKAHFPGSIRVQVVAEKNEAFRVAWAAGEIVLPGLGRILMRESGYYFPKTPPKLITLSRNAANQWHVRFACVEGEVVNARNRRLRSEGKAWADLPKDVNGLPTIEGMDMSLPDLGVSNQHGKLGRVRHLKRYARKLRQANKAASRKRKGSGRWKAACRRLGKVHARVANVRAATLKQAATRIADRSAIVCVETLQLTFMAKNSRLAKSIYDLGWASFLCYLEEAMSARGHLLLYAGQFAPTTQACSTQGCGYINCTLKNNISLRVWDCPRCGSHHDRDMNAANNIQEDAIRRFLESNGAESALSRQLHPELQAFLVRGGMTAWGSLLTVNNVAWSKRPRLSKCRKSVNFPRNLHEAVWNSRWRVRERL